MLAIIPMGIFVGLVFFTVYVIGEIVMHFVRKNQESTKHGLNASRTRGQR